MKQKRHLGGNSLLKLLTTDVHHGYTLVLPRSAITDLPGAVVGPHGLAHQMTIDQSGNIVPKIRITNDQTHSVSGIPSVNDRTLEAARTPYRFGHALLRLIHYIVALRSRHPTTAIVLSKTDWKSAYRRLHLASATAVQCITVVGTLAFLSLRLPFGGRAGPSLWSDISELAADLGNALLHDLEWDPLKDEICSPVVSSIPPPDILPPSVAFAPAKPIAVPLPVDNLGTIENYIDDGVRPIDCVSWVGLLFLG
jgi:hypothetical protein